MTTRTDRLPIGIDDVHAAAERLRGVAHRTPVLTLAHARRRAAAAACSSRPRTSSGSARSSSAAPTTRVTALAPERARRVAPPSGNHAQAVALSAALHGLHGGDPHAAGRAAVQARGDRGYGAEVLEFDRYSDDRDQMAIDLARDRGLTLVHPYDEPFVMAGQGTAGLELLDEVERPRRRARPARRRRAALGRGHGGQGAEPADAGGRGRARGEPGHAALAARRAPGARRDRRSIADGQLLPEPGEQTFAVVSALVDDIVTVSDDEIVAAMRFLFERMKIVVEPSGASALAALMAGPSRSTAPARASCCRAATSTRPGSRRSSRRPRSRRRRSASVGP